MNESLEKWSYNEFLVFLLIYTASADFSISDEEEKMMIDKIGPEKYHRMRELFRRQSDYESLQTILYFQDKYYPRPEDKEALVRDMKKLLLTDRDFSILEQNMMLIMKKLL